MFRDSKEISKLGFERYIDDSFIGTTINCKITLPIHLQRTDLTDYID